MSVVIRLSKTGKKGEAKYRIVVKEKRSRRDGTTLENLGWYEKKVNTHMKDIKRERIAFWVAQGAQMSPAVKKIVSL